MHNNSLPLYLVEEVELRITINPKDRTIRKHILNTNLFKLKYLAVNGRGDNLMEFRHPYTL